MPRWKTYQTEDTAEWVVAGHGKGASLPEGIYFIMRPYSAVWTYAPDSGRYSFDGAMRCAGPMCKDDRSRYVWRAVTAALLVYTQDHNRERGENDPPSDGVVLPLCRKCVTSWRNTSHEEIQEFLWRRIPDGILNTASRAPYQRTAPTEPRSE